MREALLTRVWLPPALRNELAAATARALADFVARCDWLSEPRAERIAREAREQATVAIARRIEGGDLEDLVASHARERHADRRRADARPGERRPRVLCSGDGRTLRPCRGGGSPPSRGALQATVSARSTQELGFPPLSCRPSARRSTTPRATARGELSLASAERAMEACGADPAAAPLRALLARLASEAARQDARSFADEVALLAPSTRAPLAIAGPASYAPLLIDAVAAALEDCIAPSVEPTLDGAYSGEDYAPLVQLPADMLAALAKAA